MAVGADRPALHAMAIRRVEPLTLPRAVLRGLLGSKLLTGWELRFYTVAWLTALAALAGGAGGRALSETLADLGRPAAPALGHP